MGSAFIFVEPGPPEKGYDHAAFEEMVGAEQDDGIVEGPRAMRELIQKMDDPSIKGIHRGFSLPGIGEPRKDAPRQEPPRLTTLNAYSKTELGLGE